MQFCAVHFGTVLKDVPDEDIHPICRIGVSKAYSYRVLR